MKPTAPWHLRRDRNDGSNCQVNPARVRAGLLISGLLNRV
jgi:hypothetical protein